jgi:hypothetical protein
MPSFTIIFDVDKNSATYGKWLFTDTTNYATDPSTPGWTPANVEGWFDISYPNGNGYTGSQSNFDLVGNGINDVIPIPQDANGVWLNGTYTFVLNLFETVLLQQVQATITYKYCPPFKFGLGDEGTIATTTDCFQYRLNVLDKTNYGTPTTITQLITLFPPQPLIDNGDATVVTSNSSSLLYVFGYTGTYVATTDTLVTYVQGNVTVSGRVTADKEISVQCSLNICNLIACYNDKLRKLTHQVAKGGYLESVDNALKTDMLLASFYLLAYKENAACGNYDRATDDYNRLAKLLGCDCGCGDVNKISNDIRLVNPNFNINIATVYNVIGQGSITVTSNTVGNTTTFTVSLSQSLINTINGNTSDITTLQGDVATLQGDVTALQVAVAGIDTLQQVVYSLYNQAVPNTGILTVMAQHTEAIGALDNGDEVEMVVEYLLTPSLSTLSSRSANIRINGTVIAGLPSPNSFSNQGETLTLKLLVKKQSNVLVSYSAEYFWALPKTLNFGIGEVQVWKKTTGQLSVPDLSANTLVLSSQAIETGTSDFSLNYATVKKYTV